MCSRFANESARINDFSRTGAKMQIKEDKQGEVLIVTVSEHLDTATASIFESRLLGMVERGERKIVVDCGELEYVKSAGLKVFLLAAKRLEPLGGKLVLCALAPSVLMIFEMIGFTRIMKIVPTQEEAVRILRGDASPT
jgi:anti-anti-sigma factor